MSSRWSEKRRDVLCLEREHPMQLLLEPGVEDRTGGLWGETGSDVSCGWATQSEQVRPSLRKSSDSGRFTQSLTGSHCE
jgi:hypothetical protein